MKLKIVSATGLGAEGFDRSLLAQSTSLPIRSICDNSVGLPKVYNEVLEESAGGGSVLFVHDDAAWDCDDSLMTELESAFQSFDVVGVAGSLLFPAPSSFPQKVKRRLGLGRAPYLVPEKWWQGMLSRHGAITHGDGPEEVFGAAPSPVDLIDGVFLAFSEMAVQAGLRFDEQFEFHHYDLDVSLAARQLGLRVGVWPIKLSHASQGGYDSESFQKSAVTFDKKWGEAVLLPAQ